MLHLLLLLADLQFPIDLSNVAKDHPFLENDPLQSLYRRLVALNRCATMRLDNTHHHSKHQSQVSGLGRNMKEWGHNLSAFQIGC